ncbi:DUF5641 domain-containing protein [Trichonephila clavipes]|nr:DUF5641 domain-containing protein [Trichonephila clavipes]
MKALGFKIGHFTVTSAFKANYARIKNAEIKSKSYTLEARRASRMRKKATNEHFAELEDDVEDLEPLTPAMFLQDIREVGVPELDQIDENKLNKRLVYRNRIRNDLRKRFRVEYFGQLRETRNIKGENTLSEGDIVLVGDDYTKRLNWNLGKILKLYPGKDKKVRVAQVKTKFGSFLRPVRKLYLLEVMENNKSSVHPTNSPLFSEANEGSHLPINIDPELSKPQRAATSSIQPCSNVSDGKAGVEPRLETLELPDVLISDGELQQPGPRRSR